MFLKDGWSVIPAEPQHVCKRNERGEWEPVLYYGYALSHEYCRQWMFKRAPEDYPEEERKDQQGEAGRALHEMGRLFPAEEVFLGSALSHSTDAKPLHIWVIGSNASKSLLRRAREFSEYKMRIMCEVLDLEFQKPQWYYRKWY